MSQSTNILITGRPGVGKTTVINKLAERLQEYHPQGFYTREIREAGVRKGFTLIDLAGSQFVLAHVDYPRRWRVGKYGVDIASFDRYLRARDFRGSDSQLIIVDEIGKMECFSDVFVQMITGLLDSEKSIIATIAEKGGRSIQNIKSRRDIHLIDLTIDNRDSAAAAIADSITRRRIR